MKVKEKEICPKCERIGALTKDHIIPQTFIRQCKRFGVYPPKGYVNTERICAGCNLEKGHDIDLGDQITQHMVRELVRVLKNKQFTWGKLEKYRYILEAYGLYTGSLPQAKR